MGILLAPGSVLGLKYDQFCWRHGERAEGLRGFCQFYRVCMVDVRPLSRFKVVLFLITVRTPDIEYHFKPGIYH